MNFDLLARESEANVHQILTCFTRGDELGIIKYSQNQDLEKILEIEIRGPDLKYTQKTCDIVLKLNRFKQEYYLAVKYFGGGLILLGYQLHYFVLDLDQVTLTQIMAHDSSQQRENDETKEAEFTSIRKENGLLYWYDVEDYLN